MKSCSKSLCFALICFKKLATRLCLGLRVCMSVDCALVFPSLLLEGSSSTSMNGFCVTSLKVRGVNVFKKLTTRLCLGLRVCISVDWALVFPSLLLEGSSSTSMNGFCVTSLKVRGVKVRLDNITLSTARLSAFSCKLSQLNCSIFNIKVNELYSLFDDHYGINTIMVIMDAT